MPTDAVFYVYVLFDHLGIPRYVGKGKGRRWLAHEQQPKGNHRLKNHFIRTTVAAIGCVPKVKIREGLSEAAAFDIEAAFIKAIGRYPTGPLVNLTDKRNGPTSERIKEWHASRSPEDRAKTMRKAAAAIPKSVRRANALACGADALSERLKAIRAKQSPERRSEIGRLGAAAKRNKRLLDQQKPVLDQS